MRFMDELKNAILKEDFYETNDVIEKIEKESNAFEYLPLIFEIMEKYPELDYGMPGPIVHFMERYYKKGYEGVLLKSVQNMPTVHTIWMLNRVLNDSNLSNREVYMEVLRSSLNRSDISPTVRKDIQSFLEYQQKK